MSLRKAFKTDKTLETKGIEVDYGTSIFTVARAGGSNKAYRKALLKALKPFRAALEAENLDDERALPAVIKAFADHCVLDCKVETPEGWKKGLEGPNDGEVWEFSHENVAKLLTEIPELYRDLQEKASGRKLFLEDLEEAAKN